MMLKHLAVNLMSECVKQLWASSPYTVTIEEEGVCECVWENTVYISVSEKQQPG